jgi:hypothetical protein
MPNYTSLTHLINSGITAGLDYQFKVRGRNKYGYGVYSDVVTIRASEAPVKMDMIVTSIDSITGGIKFDWAYPFNNYETID